jgi:putative hemolysin
VQIDLEKILNEKNPSLLKWMPSFVLNWLKRTIHQDDVNFALRESKDIKDIAFAEWALDHLQATTSSQGNENIPTQGGVIVASNHPLGGLDGNALIKEVGKVRQDIHFIINDILSNLPNFETIIVGVNKHGSNARASLLAIDKAYTSGGAVLIFPAGLCSRKQEGVIKDLVWQKSFIAKAQKNGLPIVPTHIAGKNSNWFYNLSLWRKRLGIKANIEMLYLVDEMYRQKGQTMHLTFGKPIPAAVFDKSRKPDEWAQLLKEFIYTLAKNPDGEFLEFKNANSKK